MSGVRRTEKNLNFPKQLRVHGETFDYKALSHWSAKSQATESSVAFQRHIVEGIKQSPRPEATSYLSEKWKRRKLSWSKWVMYTLMPFRINLIRSQKMKAFPHHVFASFFSIQISVILCKTEVWVRITFYDENPFMLIRLNHLTSAGGSQK